MSNTYDADIVGHMVVSYGKPGAFVSECYKPNFVCSVCKQRVNDKVVAVTARREHLIFHTDCADRFILAMEHALIKMGHNFKNEDADD